MIEGLRVSEIIPEMRSDQAHVKAGLFAMTIPGTGQSPEINFFGHAAQHQKEGQGITKAHAVGRRERSHPPPGTAGNIPTENPIPVDSVRESVVWFRCYFGLMVEATFRLTRGPSCGGGGAVGGDGENMRKLRGKLRENAEDTRKLCGRFE